MKSAIKLPLFSTWCLCTNCNLVERTRRLKLFEISAIVLPHQFIRSRLGARSGPFKVSQILLFFRYLFICQKTRELSKVYQSFSGCSLFCLEAPLLNVDRPFSLRIMSQREAPESTTKAEEKNDNLLFLSREKGMFYRVLNNYRDFPLPSLLLLHDCLPACLLKASNIQLSFFFELCFHAFIQPS